MTTVFLPPRAAAPPAAREPAVDSYRPFAIKAGRNWREEHLELPIMLRALGLTRAERVLEIGCGPGIALPVLAGRLGPTYLVGLDVDSTLLAQARRRVNAAGVDADLVPGDVRSIPFPDKTFDLVIDFGTCFHIANSDRALLEIARVLKPGGAFATETPWSQLLSHPIRSFGRQLPWSIVPALRRRRHAGLWELRRMAG
jgi:ubiquinone/menaquinone biosynthesis C-methylase UbiE